MNWYLAVLKNYVGFSGRAGRREFWMFYLINAIILIALSLLFSLTREPLLYIPFFLYLVAVLLPTLAAIVRRLHDTGRSGWWYFINFVPGVGSIILLVLLALEGQHGSNQYGDDPRNA